MLLGNLHTGALRFTHILTPTHSFTVRETNRQADGASEKKGRGGSRDRQTDGRTDRERERCIWLVPAYILHIIHGIFCPLFQ